MQPRIRAFLIHLSASAALALLSLVVVFAVWYPAPLYRAVGVTDIFLLLLGVDVVIGPVLTLIVYRVGKNSLRFDLATIVFLQLASFSYGFWTVAEGRPAWVVFNKDRFDLVSAYQIDERKLDQAAALYRNPSWFGPNWVASRLPDDVNQRNTILFEAVVGGIAIPQHPELFQPLESAADELRNAAHPLDDLARYNAAEAVALVRARWPEADAFLPMMAKVKPLTVLINRESARVIAVVDLSPWE